MAGDKPGKANDDMRELVRQVELAAAALPASEKVMEASLQELQSRTQLPKNSVQADKDRAAAIRRLLQPGRRSRTRAKQLHRAAGKAEIVRACRNLLGEKALAWTDAAIVVKGNQDLAYPPLLGTGGGEGRLDYTNAFMSCIASLLLSPDPGSRPEALLRNALFGEPTGDLAIASFGQYDPGRAGGFNQGFEIETKDFPINPWDFILTMEGAIVWAAGVARRNATDGGASLSTPFAVRSKPVGYCSAAERDGTAARAEVWAPLWQRPAGYNEVRAIFAEGRADVGRKRASHSIEFAEAAASLGVDRGVSAFMRYSLVKRRGDSYVALPAGRFPVQERSESDLLRQLDPILERVDRFLRGFKNESPARFSSARRAIDEAMFSVLLHGGPIRLKQLLAAMGRLERLFAERDLTRKPKLNSPLTGLNPRWLLAADDGSIEIRIAAALASIGPTGAVGPLRANLSPVDPERPYRWAKGKGQTSWVGHSLAARLAATLERRMMDGERLDCRANPLWGAMPILTEDALGLVDGDVDESLLEDLVFGLSWVDHRLVSEVRVTLKERWRVPVRRRIIPRSWSLLKLLFLPGNLPGPGGREVEVRPEPSILRLLRAGRAGQACLVAARRLYAAGLTPVQSRFPDGVDGTRLAAALLVPVRDVHKCVRQVLYVTPED